MGRWLRQQLAESVHARMLSPMAAHRLGKQTTQGQHHRLEHLGLVRTERAHVVQVGDEVCLGLYRSMRGNGALRERSTT